MKQHRKYFRRGVPIPEAEALDHRGLIRDGVALHVPVSLRDAASKTQVVDALGGAARLHQPGPRYLTADAARARRDKAVAYAAYDAEAANAWRSPPTGAGANPNGPIGQREGDLCTINGAPGHLQMVNGALQCVPDNSDDEELEDFGAEGSAFAAKTSERRRMSSARSDQAARDHAVRMRDTYAAYDAEIAQAWKSR
jgi:hypothetical protein